MAFNESKHRLTQLVEGRLGRIYHLQEAAQQKTKDQLRKEDQQTLEKDLVLRPLLERAHNLILRSELEDVSNIQPNNGITEEWCHEVIKLLTPVT